MKTYSFTLTLEEADWFEGLLNDYKTTIMEKMWTEAEVEWCKKHLEWVDGITSKIHGENK